MVTCVFAQDIPAGMRMELIESEDDSRDQYTIFKYKEKNYSAKQLATELETNTRYISAVISVKFHTNYTTFVNQLRINDAMSLLIDKRFADLTMEEIGDMVGFSNRQSFYASFYKITGKSPRAYRKEHEERLGNKK